MRQLSIILILFFCVVCRGQTLNVERTDSTIKATLVCDSVVAITGFFVFDAKTSKEITHWKTQISHKDNICEILTHCKSPEQPVVTVTWIDKMSRIITIWSQPLEMIF